MKKALVSLIIISLTLSACTPTVTLHKADFAGPIFEFFSLSSYYKDGQYYVCDGFGETVSEYLIFSEDRELIKKVNLDFDLLDPSKVATTDALRSFLGQNTDEVEKVLGDNHFDLASGLYKPSYITSDAYLVIFGVFSSEIAFVTKIDLLTGHREEYSRNGTGAGSLS